MARPVAALTPVTRTGGYAARAVRRYLGGGPGDDLPLARPTPALIGQAFRDEVVLSLLRRTRPVSEHAVFTRITREVTEAVELYEALGWPADPESFHTAPPPLERVRIRARRSAWSAYQLMTWRSGYAPHPGEPGRDRWLGYTANSMATAWMLRHDEPRPWIVCVHGAAMGQPALDMALFRARWLHERLGLNVAMPVLPLHGPRGWGLPRGVAFPAEDMLDNVHAAAQAVWDVRRLLSWLRDHEGADRIGMTSISLGGYVTAMVASLEDDLTCAILGVPVADLVDLVERHSGLGPHDRRLQTLVLARRLGPVVSPLAMAPRVPPEGRFIYAGLADRMVHPRQQVVRLWEHWGRPEITWYAGGHTGFFRSRPVQEFVHQALLQSGLAAPPAGLGAERPAG
jgi:hypothetical protein